MALHLREIVALVLGGALALHGSASAFAEPPKSMGSQEPKVEEVLFPAPRTRASTRLEPPENLRLQREALHGPRWEVAGGTLLMIGGVLTGAIVGFATGPGLFPCGLSDDPVCEARARRDERRAVRTGVVVGSVPVAVGIGLVIHGSLRIQRIRATHRHLLLSIAPNRVDRFGGELVGRVAF